MSRKPTGAVRWCVENGIRPGDTIEIMHKTNMQLRNGRWTFDEEWAQVRVTGFGESAILTRRKGCGEYAHGDPKRLRKAEQ